MLKGVLKSWNKEVFRGHKVKKKEILEKIKAIGSQEEISSLGELLKEERQPLNAKFTDLVRNIVAGSKRPR